jgi:hypothetical protein
MATEQSKTKTPSLGSMAAFNAIMAAGESKTTKPSPSSMPGLDGLLGAGNHRRGKSTGAVTQPQSAATVEELTEKFGLHINRLREMRRNAVDTADSKGTSARDKIALGAQANTEATESSSSKYLDFMTGRSVVDYSRFAASEEKKASRDFLSTPNGVHWPLRSKRADVKYAFGKAENNEIDLARGGYLARKYGMPFGDC